MAKKKKKTEIKRDRKGRVLPGSSLNPKGRPPLNETRLDKLLQSISRIETKKNIFFLDHFVERAYESDTVLIAVMKKLIPDLKSIEGMFAGAFGQLSDADAMEIQEEMKKRFE